jgi:very-short-patch-repair endonuclease
VHAKRANESPDAFIARLAANQHGVVSVAQLELTGIHRQGRRSRLQARRLHRIHRGVYAVGHPGLSEKGWWMAAVLACGPDAVLSHTSAAALWGMLSTRARSSPAKSRPAVTHVTVPTRGGRATRAGIRVHRSQTLFSSEVTRRAGIPVTTPSRTLTDLRRLLPTPQFAAALRQAEFLGLPLDPALEPDRTRSELETRFLALCRRHRLPKPEVNVPVGPFIVDFLWPGRRLIVELDGYRAHAGREAFEADRARDVELKSLGYDVIRFTWRGLRTDPVGVASTIRVLLRRAARAAT